MLGGKGAMFMTLAALLSTYGWLASNMLNVPRLSMAMADRGDLPSFFNRIHPVFRTPYISIIFFRGASRLFLALQAGLVSNLSLSAVSRLFTYGVVCAALPVFRRWDREHAGTGGLARISGAGRQCAGGVRRADFPGAHFADDRAGSDDAVGRGDDCNGPLADRHGSRAKSTGAQSKGKGQLHDSRSSFVSAIRRRRECRCPLVRARGHEAWAAEPSVRPSARLPVLSEIRLDCNENPLGPPAEALRAMTDWYGEAGRYPDLMYDPLYDGDRALRRRAARIDSPGLGFGRNPQGGDRDLREPIARA